MSATTLDPRNWISIMGASTDGRTKLNREALRRCVIAGSIKGKRGSSGVKSHWYIPMKVYMDFVRQTKREGGVEELLHPMDAANRAGIPKHDLTYLLDRFWRRGVVLREGSDIDGQFNETHKFLYYSDERVQGRVQGRVGIRNAHFKYTVPGTEEKIAPNLVRRGALREMCDFLYDHRVKIEFPSRVRELAPKILIQVDDPYGIKDYLPVVFCVNSSFRDTCNQPRRCVVYVEMRDVKLFRPSDRNGDSYFLWSLYQSEDEDKKQRVRFARFDHHNVAIFDVPVLEKILDELSPDIKRVLYVGNNEMELLKTLGNEVIFQRAESYSTADKPSWFNDIVRMYEKHRRMLYQDQYWYLERQGNAVS